jgi:hypothetical protein
MTPEGPATLAAPATPRTAAATVAAWPTLSWISMYAAII